MKFKIRKFENLKIENSYLLNTTDLFPLKYREITQLISDL